ncbi:hypothetical protein SARC_09775, partial [Sphaeroforma arctica JP610]
TQSSHSTSSAVTSQRVPTTVESQNDGLQITRQVDSPAYTPEGKISIDRSRSTSSSPREGEFGKDTSLLKKVRGKTKKHMRSRSALLPHRVVPSRVYSNLSVRGGLPNVGDADCISLKPRRTNTAAGARMHRKNNFDTKSNSVDNSHTVLDMHVSGSCNDHSDCSPVCHLPLDGQNCAGFTASEKKAISPVHSSDEVRREFSRKVTATNVTPGLYANTISHRDLSTSACKENAETDAYSDTDTSVAAKVMLKKTKSLAEISSERYHLQAETHHRIHRCKSENLDMSSQSGTAMPTPVYERSDMSFFETELVIPQASDLSSISKSKEHIRSDEQDPINLENYSGSGTTSSSFFRKLTHIFGRGS